MFISSRRGFHLVKQLLTERGIFQSDYSRRYSPRHQILSICGRLRRTEMNPPLECIRTTVSWHLPHAMFLYLPRVANSIADDLAGQASRFLLVKFRSDPINFHRSSGPVSIRPAFPTPFSKREAFTSKASNMPGCSQFSPGRKARHRSWTPSQASYPPPTSPTAYRIISLPCMPQCCSIEIGYSPRAVDHLGRNIVVQWRTKTTKGS